MRSKEIVKMAVEMKNPPRIPLLFFNEEYHNIGMSDGNYGNIVEAFETYGSGFIK